MLQHPDRNQKIPTSRSCTQLRPHLRCPTVPLHPPTHPAYPPPTCQLCHGQHIPLLHLVAGHQGKHLWAQQHPRPRSRRAHRVPLLHNTGQAGGQAGGWVGGVSGWTDRWRGQQRPTWVVPNGMLGSRLGARASLQAGIPCGSRAGSTHMADIHHGGLAAGIHMRQRGSSSSSASGGSTAAADAAAAPRGCTTVAAAAGNAAGSARIVMAAAAAAAAATAGLGSRRRASQRGHLLRQRGRRDGPTRALLLHAKEAEQLAVGCLHL